MGRKVFLSVLGTGFYGKCSYHDKSHETELTRFIQKATLECIDTASWTNEDCVYFLLTEDAYKLNWDRNITCRKNNKGIEEEYYGLQHELDEMNLAFEVKDILIPKGKDEKEIWEIFLKVYDVLQEDDELYIDLTHGFRYLPMLVLVLENYAKFLKNITVKHLSYGNFEMREGNRAPIIDLLPLSALQDWTFASASFLKYGNADNLVDLANADLNSILRNAATRTEDAKNLRGFISSFKSFVDDLLTCRGMSIINSQKIKSMQSCIKNINNVVLEPFKPVFEKIKQSLEQFDESPNINNALAAARWCFDVHSYQTAITFLQEFIVTTICSRHNIGINMEKLRHLVNDAFSIKFDNIPKDKWKVALGDMEKFEEILHDPIICDEELIKNFRILTNVRNDMNHSGMRSKQTPMNPQNLIDNIDKCMIKVEETYNNIVFENIISKKILINLSNHPSEEWEKEQKDSAKGKFEEIIDIDFPNISPSIKEEEFNELVNEYANKILDYKYSYNIVVHVMGEMTFTFALVNRLKEEGIRCVASCTERKVEVTPDGMKHVMFKFEKFRDYV